MHRLWVYCWFVIGCRRFSCFKKLECSFSDISGAIDRAVTKKLLATMRRLGICESLMVLFENYLTPRTLRVAVDRAVSFEFILENMVFQRTVFGPGFWNICFR